MHVDRKFDIFVSSTKTDLDTLRREVIELIIAKEHTPLAMEYFGAGAVIKEQIKDTIQRCDIFILIFGEKYGDLIPDDSISYVEFEYNLAVSMEKHIFSLLLDEEDFQKGPREPNAVEFRKKILLNSKVSGFYKNTEKIAGVVLKPLDQAITALNEKQQGGWIPARYYDEIKDLETLKRSESSNEIFMEILDSIRGHDYFIQRGRDLQKEKKMMAEYYWDTCNKGIFFDSNIDSLFFESSSTIQFVTRHMINYMNATEAFRRQDVRRISIYTNCLFNMLNFTLHCGRHTFVRSVNYLPKPPFYTNQGSTFGRLETLPIPNPQMYKDNKWSHSIEEWNCLRYVAKQFGEKLEKNRGIIHMSIHGFSKELILFSRGFYNSLLTTIFFFDNLKEIPKVLFIDRSKFNVEFDPHSCFPVFGDEERWVRILVPTPYAWYCLI